MCGIVGVLSIDGKGRIEEGVTKKMCKALYHRGPDEEGFYFEDSVGLGVRRLSIIDIVTGSQPIHNEDKSVWVIQNGEIYNFKELKEDLLKKGHRFYTKSDTEVLVHLYEDFGDNFVSHLNGMFAICIWDRKEKKLLVARDRFGIKPLYYTQTEGFFAFSSEIKGILEYSLVERKIDLASLNKYLTYEYIPAPNTIFVGIKKLLPGHLLICDRKGIKIKRYWSMNFEKRVRRKEEEYTEELITLFEESVKRMLVADVPLGLFLSGGIDSSSIAAAMRMFLSTKMKSFSIGFEESSFDESQYAKEVADYLDTEHHHQVLSSKKMLSLIPKITTILDEPLADASIVPTYLLSSFTKEYVAVALSGDGGDELFAGYPTYQAHRLATYHERLPKTIQGLIGKAINSLPVSFENISLDFRLKRFISGINLPPYCRNLIWLGSFRPEEKRLLAPWIDDEMEMSCFKEAEEYLESINSEDLIESMLALDMRFYLQDDLLTKVDRASMAASLEVRVPYLDHTFVQFVASLPSELKLKGFTTKYIFKKAMEKRLPKKIVHRKKKGFGIPVAKWIRKELRGFVLDILTENRIKEEGLFSYPYIETILKEHFEGRKDNRKLIWTLLIFELWYKKWIKRE